MSVSNTSNIDSDTAFPYQCPATGQALTPCGDELVTTDGQRRYPLVDGIPNFCEFPPAESEDAGSRLQRMNAAAADLGWRRALEENWPEVVDYATDPGRLKLLDVLPLDSRATVLEIGCGLGQFTAALAARSKQVYALDVVAGQTKFAKTRCAQTGANNVSVACGGDNLRLPFRTAMFDSVIMNLVIEWCANRQQTLDDFQGQKLLLSEILRVLKPGGFLWMSTKNRFALPYLLGRGDEHTGLRFGNALPRWLMYRQLRRLGKTRPAGLLHSYNQWLRTFHEIGFDSINAFWAAPEMRLPHKYIPLDKASIRQARKEGDFAQGDSRLTRLVMPWIPAGLIKHFSRGHCFLIHKPIGNS